MKSCLGFKLLAYRFGMPPRSFCGPASGYIFADTRMLYVFWFGCGRFELYGFQRFSAHYIACGGSPPVKFSAIPYYMVVAVLRQSSFQLFSAHYMFVAVISQSSFHRFSATFFYQRLSATCFSSAVLRYILFHHRRLHADQRSSAACCHHTAVVCYINSHVRSCALIERAINYV